MISAIQSLLSTHALEGPKLACRVWTFGLLSSETAYLLSVKISSGFPVSCMRVVAAFKAALRSSALQKDKVCVVCFLYELRGCSELNLKRLRSASLFCVLSKGSSSQECGYQSDQRGSRPASRRDRLKTWMPGQLKRLSAQFQRPRVAPSVHAVSLRSTTCRALYNSTCACHRPSSTRDHHSRLHS